MNEFPKSQLLSPPDGDVIGTLTDPRVLATAGGVVVGNYAEKFLYKSARGLFGIAVPSTNGKAVFYSVKADGSADTSAAVPKYGVNRQLARAAGVVGAVAVIEYVNNGPAQYGLLGSASVWLAHALQDVFPILNT